MMAILLLLLFLSFVSLAAFSLALYQSYFAVVVVPVLFSCSCVVFLFLCCCVLLLLFIFLTNMSYGKYCMVKTCRNNKKDFPKLSFFSLPKKMEIALKWMEFAGRNDNDLDKEYTMCSEHFIESQFKTVYPCKLLYPGSIPCIKGPHAMKRVNENDALNTDGSIPFMKGPCAMETDIESGTANTDYIPSCSNVPKRNSSMKNIAKSSLRRDSKIKKLNKTVNSLRCKIYRKKVPVCFCQSKPPICSNKVTINRLINESKNYLSKEAHVLFANELRASFVKKYNRRYDDSVREMCLLWY
ncbi:uncharacterized protein LOC123312564 [Coccinella septempunctata]|uniref:uncharacterized protein LOC123312564 n=1 Tax=Coccinella septempunctata TaxID=41139 RepID=UPI001D076E9A|nr:uncharacterized protein LOC123312564 [Coccinella septempunctata]